MTYRCPAIKQPRLCWLIENDYDFFSFKIFQPLYKVNTEFTNLKIIKKN